MGAANMPNIDLEMIANSSYAILLVSYIMKDILWLRVLTVISLCFEIPYFYFQPDPLWDGISWDMTFIAINAYWIGRLAYDRRPVHFTTNQKHLWQTALHRLHPRHARDLFRIGKIRTVAAGGTVSTQGDTLHELALISDGKVRIILDEKQIEHLGPGHFIGGASFLESDPNFTQFVTIVADGPTSLITWDKRQLKSLVESDNQLSMAIEATLGLDAAHLLYKAWKREASAAEGGS